VKETQKLASHVQGRGHSFAMSAIPNSFLGLEIHFAVETTSNIRVIQVVYSMLTAMTFLTEFAENGSIHDYLHRDHKQPPLSQILLWSTQVAEGIVMAGQSKPIQIHV